MAAAAFVVGTGVSALALAPAGAAATPTVASWQQAIGALPLSSEGCFTATFPAVQWQDAPCQAAPVVPFAPAPGEAPSTIGNGIDYSAVSSGLLSSVTGSFPSVSAGVTEKGAVPVAGTPTKPNTYSLQLNTSFFVPSKSAGSSTSVCSGSSTPKSCLAWQQFVLSTSPDSAARPLLFMQYWLINYNASCPAGWYTYGPDCYTNSNATSVPVVKASGLGSVSLEGSAAAGGLDKVELSTGSKVYAVSHSDSQVNLASKWKTAEFGVFGDGDGSQAIFGAGTTLQVMTATNDGTALAPSCRHEGFTGETNNLNLVKTPATAAGSTPGIVSEQSNTLTTSPSCVRSPSS